MFSRITKYAVKNTLRNKFLSLSSILVLTLLMFFINILFVLHEVSLQIIDSINSKLTISLYLEDEYDKNTVEVIGLMNDIASVDKNISVDYKNQDQILDDIKGTHPDLVSVLETTNPLPETIVISDITLSTYEKVNELITSRIFLISNGDEGVENFSNYSAQYERITQITKTLEMLQFGLYVVIGVFLLSIAVITYSIIGNFIYYYRDEIYITQLVGGSKIFIYGPFSIQGAIYTVTSFVISFIVFALLVENLSYIFEGSFEFDIFSSYSGMIFALQLIIFIFIGAMSGYMSSKRYLK